MNNNSTHRKSKTLANRFFDFNYILSALPFGLTKAVKFLLHHVVMLSQQLADLNLGTYVFPDNFQQHNTPELKLQPVYFNPTGGQFNKTAIQL